jgi:hypothetical protein
MNCALEQACHEMLTFIAKRCTEVFLVQQNRLSSMIHFNLIHRQWGPAGCIYLKYFDPNQTLILLELPPEPDLEESEAHIPAILELGPEENTAVRLAHVNGSDERVLILVRELLHKKRNTYNIMLQSRLVPTFGLNMMISIPTQPIGIS